MCDKISQVENAIKSIVKNKKLTRTDKYCFVKEKFDALSEDEKKIIINEFKRYYDFCDKNNDIKEILNMFLNGLLIVSTLATTILMCLVNQVGWLWKLYILLTIYIVFAILVLAITQAHRKANMSCIQYILDILES